MSKFLIKTILLFIVVSFLLSIGLPIAEASSYRYQGNVEFYFSNDGGARYGREGRIFYSDETILMQVRFSVTIVNRRMFTARTSQVVAVLTIPNIDAVDVLYMEGQIVEPIIDNINNVVKYEYTVTAESDPTEQRIVFQLKPNAPVSIRMTFEFDEEADINPTSNSQHTVEFIEREIIVDEPEEEDEIIEEDIDDEIPETTDNSNIDFEDDKNINTNVDNKEQSSNDNLLVIVIIIVGAAIVISIIALIIVLIKFLNKNNKQNS